MVESKISEKLFEGHEKGTPVTLKIYADTPNEDGKDSLGNDTRGGHAWIEVKYQNENGELVTHTLGTWPDNNIEGEENSFSIWEKGTRVSGNELWLDHPFENPAAHNPSKKNRDIDEDDDASREVTINSDQIQKLKEVIADYESMGSDAWELFNKNCTYFSSDLWEKVTGEKLEINSKNKLIAYFTIDFPETLAESIKKQNAESAKMQNMKKKRKECCESILEELNERIENMGQEIRIFGDFHIIL